MSVSRRWVSALFALALLHGVAGPEPAAHASPAPEPQLRERETVQSFDPASVRLEPESPEALTRALLAAGDAAGARREAEAALATASRESRGRLLWLLASAARNDEERERHWHALLESTHPLRRWAALRLAEAWAERKDAAAEDLARALTQGWAGASRAARLVERIERARRPPVEPPPSVEQPSAQELSHREALERARALYVARKYEHAQAAYEKLARRIRDDAALSCEVGLEHGRVLVARKLREDSVAHMRALATRCDAEVRTWAHYFTGQTLLRSGEPAASIEPLEALVQHAPESTLADDALTMIAVAHADLGQAAEQVRALERLVTSYPNGDMHAEARFTLGMLARARGEHAVAIGHFDGLLAHGPHETAEGIEGRAAYWRARTLHDSGAIDAAVAAYEDVVRSTWLGYHAQQALMRIGELRPARAAELRARFTPPSGQRRPLLFAYRAEMDEAAFASALELLRVGETALALDELRWLRALEASADAELAWLAAALVHESGAIAEASRLVRFRVRHLPAELPVERAQALLRIAYPNAFSPTLEQAADEASVPAAFVRAIAREESSFDPDVVSTARAYGLVQLIVPTARPYARALGLPSDPAALKRPDVNLRIGSRFIADLFRRYDGHAAFVPAAYNAGPGATDRWLAGAAGKPLDEWVEAIPYRETRRYTRRVLQTFGVYTWLEHGRVPELPRTLPAL